MNMLVVARSGSGVSNHRLTATVPFGVRGHDVKGISTGCDAERFTEIHLGASMRISGDTMPVSMGVWFASSIFDEEAEGANNLSGEVT